MIQINDNAVSTIDGAPDGSVERNVTPPVGISCF